MKNHIRCLLAACCLAGIEPAASAQTVVAPPADTGTVVKMDPFSVTQGHDDPLQVISMDATNASFGLDQSIFDTPRAITSISAEMMDRYDVTNIDDLTRISPGTFTSSFYGIAGQIDVRGTPGDTYFRDMKRIENPGNFPTPIAAADRIDIVRGPPSPIFGAGKVGGYLDFFPKSSRAETGLYIDGDAGILTAIYGSWDKKVENAEVGGSGTILGKKAGYYVYISSEDSGSYYRNGFTKQAILQTTFDVDLTPTVRIELGEQYQWWNGTENAGWNRVTQALIDHGTYLAGSPLLNLDTNGDGAISPAEATAAGGLSTTSVYGTPPKLGPQYALNPATVHYVTLPRSDVLIDNGDGALSKSFNTFFDTIDDINPDLTATNKFYTDYLDRDKHSSYGFSQYNHAYSIEDRVVFDQTLQVAPWFKMQNAYSLGFRYYDAIGASDSFFELAERRDLSVGGTPNDRVWLSWFRPDLNPWGSWVHSIYEDTGGAILSDLTFWDKAHLLLGGRDDYINFFSQNAQHIRTGSGLYAYAFKKPVGFSGSFSYDVTPWLKPYITYAQQPTPLIGQTGEVTVASLEANPLYSSDLREAGIKAELLNKKLYFDTDIYRQNRSSFDVLTNSITAYVAQGYEAELRFVPTKELSFTGAVTLQKTVYDPLVARTVYANPTVAGLSDPSTGYAGDERVTLPATPFFAERPGEPDRVMSLYGTYLFDDGLGFTLGAVYTSRVSAGASELVELPSSLVFTTSISYQYKRWRAKLGIDNLTNVRYFHSLSPDSFGDFTVLPEPPRSANFSIAYRF
jgi:iron complex outermembrane receptor protein